MNFSKEQSARLRLARSENVGPITYRALLNRFGDAQTALEALPDLARKGGVQRRLKIYTQAQAEQELAAIAAQGAQLLVLGLAPYPSLLAQIEDAPPALIIKGHLSLLDKPTIAMVGARNASAAGIRFARALAHALSQHEFIVVSGLARGIDGAAHEGALERGTIGVVAGGLDVFYPPEHATLQQHIGAQGLLVAEQPLGVEPQARHFPRRNRIISGLSFGVVVVEAALRSGSLITARMAADQGREVLAVPGSPMDARAQGCNQLIREGATLVQSAEDVIEVFARLRVQGSAEPERPFTPTPPMLWSEPQQSERERLIGMLSPTPVHVDELIRLMQMNAGLVQAILIELDLAGRLVRHAGGHVSLYQEPV
jgi:DNA processing protein